MAAATGPQLTAREQQLDLVPLEPQFQGEPMTLSVQELWVLKVLMRNHDRCVPRARLETSVYNWNIQIGSNTLEVYI